MKAKRFHIKTILICLLLLFCAFIGILGGVLYAVTRDVPAIRDLENYQPSSVTRIFSSDKVLLSEMFVEKRIPVPLEKIPRKLTQALLATEDRAFYRHSGVDLKGILRAAAKDVLAGKFAEGASTISQQLAKTLFLTPEKKLTRKIKEAFLAFQLERRYTKNEILELYLNQVYFGSGAYGVEAAARRFFGKSVDVLSLSECALIAGMPKAPSRYSPWVNLDLAIKRRNVVLSQMKATGGITEEIYKAAVAEPVALKSDPRKAKAPYFIAYIRDLLETRFGSSLAYKGGLTVHTTLSHHLQTAAETAVEKGLSMLTKRMKGRKNADPDPQGALISLNVSTGAIISMVGGKDFFKSRYNRSLSAHRQPGSAFKPIVYAYAIEQGFTQSSLILDAPVVYKGTDGQKDYRPENYSDKFLGEISLRHALAKSQNIPAVRLLEKLGPEPVIQFAYRLGIKGSLQPNLSLALGSSGISLIDLTAAYAVFANGGKAVEPYGIASVKDSRDRLLWQASPKPRAVISLAAAAIVTDMLKAVIQEGTGRKAQGLHRPLAGKTGTTNSFKDALFVGYSPSIAAGVWVGRDAYESLGKEETGARAALPIWIRYMSAALSDTPYQVFALPGDVHRISVDPVTGIRASAGNTASVKAVFRIGSEPG